MNSGMEHVSSGNIQKTHASRRRFLLRFRIEDVFFILCLIFCVYPMGYGSFVPALGRIYMYGKYAVIAVIALMIVLRKYQPSFMALMLVTFDAYLLVTTVAFGGNLNRWAQFALYRIALVCVVDYMFSKRPTFALGSLSVVCLVHLALNEVLGSAGTTSLNVDNAMYWLGIRVRIAGYALPAMAFALLFFIYSRTSKWIKLPLLVAVYALSIDFFIQRSVSTALVSTSVALLLLVIFVYHEQVLQKISIIGFVAIVLLNFGIIFFNVQNMFSWLIEGILGKSLTLTGRIGIWNAVLDNMKGHYLFGHGVGSGIPFIYEFGEPVTYEHNQLLNVLFSGGIVGLAFFLFILFTAFSKIQKTNPSPFTYVTVAFLLALCVQMISEHPYENAFFAVLLLLGYRAGDIPLPDTQRVFKRLRFSLR